MSFGKSSLAWPAPLVLLSCCSAQPTSKPTCPQTHLLPNPPSPKPTSSQTHLTPKANPRPHPAPGLWSKLHAARASAQSAAESALTAALAGVELSEAERKAAGTKLQTAGQTKLGSLLQVPGANALRVWAVARSTALLCTANSFGGHLLHGPCCQLLARQCMQAARMHNSCRCHTKATQPSTPPGGASRCPPQEAALTRVSRMRDAFNTSFTLDENKTPRCVGPRSCSAIIERVDGVHGSP
jgi:hypothetical protein